MPADIYFTKIFHACFSNYLSIFLQNLDNSLVYTNASILGSVQLVSFLLASAIVNKTGKKLLCSKMSETVKIFHNEQYSFSVFSDIVRFC